MSVPFHSCALTRLQHQLPLTDSPKFKFPLQRQYLIARIIEHGATRWTDNHGTADTPAAIIATTIEASSRSTKRSERATPTTYSELRRSNGSSRKTLPSYDTWHAQLERLWHAQLEWLFQRGGSTLPKQSWRLCASETCSAPHVYSVAAYPWELQSAGRTPKRNDHRVSWRISARLADGGTRSAKSTGGGSLPSPRTKGGIGDIKDQIVLPRKEERHEQRKQCTQGVTISATGVKES